ncbi:MAG: DUF6384 family protein [Gammaproteobacteria bacterium]|nr:DUF6384 family protein [Gammaproteobacteria bacterium]
MASITKKVPLEDLMAAMDVVDTLRHQQLLVDRELDADTRRERLIKKLRGIYQAQGLDISDQVLAEGVRAMEEDRFEYSPPEASFMSRLATIYVNRDKWLKPVMLGLAVLIALPILYYFAIIRPGVIAQNALPSQLTQHYEEVITVAKDQGVITKARQLQKSGKQALKSENYDEAQEAVEALSLMLGQLKTAYTLRIVQRPGERSGLWRIPDVNERARNYYLIVEAVDNQGNILTLPIANEESGQIKRVSKWGIRVAPETYQRIVADKQDDGIIQNRNVGKKSRGMLQPEYSISTSGAAITSW